MVELKSCPFCGSDELSHGWNGSSDEEQGVVQCHGCGAAMIGEWEDQAIARWNLRAATASPLGGQSQALDDLNPPIKTEPARGWRPDREAVARIIDPVSWRKAEERPERMRPRDSVFESVAMSLAKADAILNLPPAPSEVKD